ncbi:MAG: hypothetical protein JNL75_09800 [Chitinophagales bacterium]|nr:hypothetical protein [Chitinophagales bacterium]
MEVLLEEMKKEIIQIINDNQDEEFLNRVLALLEIQSIKVKRDPSSVITGEELKERLYKHIDNLPWKS